MPIQAASTICQKIKDLPERHNDKNASLMNGHTK
ncbi:hypothetical protein PROAA_460019 [Candidatus Propionivibrio aalborgensis]|uniref:Uncharacterized protein n=1 Tax=Candidatus Propionivibrio aalborgensis TaxID=1860101 RepID=A0A1A8XZP2_9RHOO|nr:hypothetical protein PROAA_460019 [Candidatus Propionivibrio aalborgensis]